MRKLLFATLFVSTSLLLNAQISKNQWLLGGALNLKYQKEAETQFTYTLSPSGGYFVVDKFAVGARSSFTNDASFRAGYGNYHSNSFGPFARYYVLPKDKKLNLFGDVAYLHNWSDFLNSNQFILKAGPAFFITSSVALEFTVEYDDINYVNTSSSSHEFRTGIGFQVHLGKAKQTK